MGTMKRTKESRVGLSLTSLCGGALAFNLLLVIGLLAVLAWYGLGYFWPRPLDLLELRDGKRLLVEVQDREPIPGAAGASRLFVKLGNRDVDGKSSEWIDEREIVARSRPKSAVVVERLEWGNFHGELVELRGGGVTSASGADATWAAFPAVHAKKIEEREAILRVEKGPIARVNSDLEALRLEKKKIERRVADAAERARREAEVDARIAERSAEYDRLSETVGKMRAALATDVVVGRMADGREKPIAVADVVRAVQPNAMGTLAKLGLYFSRVWEFLSTSPRESNTEGGVFPAIFGTVLMVFLMSVAVAPLGVLAALFLREYAKQGVLVRIVRISVNNLAGVPSIVFGVFGLGFFVYGIGGTIDRIFYPDALPTPTFGTGGILWASLTLALLTVPVVIVAAEEGFASVPRILREGSLALGATKFETIRRVVIPAAAPGILTGMILAMARAAGEVAPLMIVGMVKLADVPLDGRFPFLHPERKFMHLGFHVYDVGFQSVDAQLAKPLVFATALLLVTVVTVMNLAAISLRNHLRRRYASSVL
jgi:phosphate transport system permease protein